MSDGEDENDEMGPGSRRWLLFLIRPNDLLRLFQLLARDDRPEMYASPFPPDTRIVEAFFDGERGCFGMMLASGFFEAVTVTRNGDDGRLSAAWNQLIFDLNEVEDAADVPADLWAEAPSDAAAAGAEPFAPPAPAALGPDASEKRWCAFFVKPAQVLWLLNVLAARRPYQTQRAFPPDARLVFGTWDAQREAFGLILSSEDFDLIGVETADDGDTLRLALPERALTISATDEGVPPPP